MLGKAASVPMRGASGPQVGPAGVEGDGEADDEGETEDEDGEAEDLPNLQRDADDKPAPASTVMRIEMNFIVHEALEQDE